MSTLYIRNVPDEVVEDLQTLAGWHHMSVNSFVLKELETMSRRARNAALLEDLPDTATPISDILAALDAVRGER